MRRDPASERCSGGPTVDRGLPFSSLRYHRTVLQTEDDIRDFLSANVGCIEPGLVFRKKELYIPNELGTRSFIDLVATDLRGHWVLIELKRSAAASREAIHEILKYVEGVKKYLAVRDHELRVIIASTEWKELLIPFSKLVEQTQIAIAGVHLVVSDSSITGEPVAVLPVEHGRILAPWCDLNYCSSETEVEQAIRDYESRNELKGLNDYLLLVLHSQDAHPAPHEAKMRLLFTGIPVDEQIAPDAEHLTFPQIASYSHILYFSSQMLREDDYWAILSKDADTIGGHREIADGLEGDELSCYLHESVHSMGEPVHRAYFEIGNPAKLAALLDLEEWEPVKLLRYGAFRRNSVLTDETLMEELRGNAGETGQKFKRVFAISNVAEVSSARNGVLGCLENNYAWRTAINLALDEVAADYPDARVDMRLFHPSTGLLTVYYSLTMPDGIYVPDYSMVAFIGETPVRVYTGWLRGVGAPRPLHSIIDEFFHGQIGELLMTMTWGGCTPSDAPLLEACGFQYASFRCDDPGQAEQFYRLEQKGWVRCVFENPFEAYARYIALHRSFFEELVQAIGERDNGGVIDGSVGGH
jgi:hypothetical protein